MSELLKINVSEHIEKKGNLSYLSWAWAWAEVLKIDATASWNVVEYNGLPCMFLPDGSAMVRVYVTIRGDVKSCVLPVMDNRNNAVKNPDSRKISDAIMRCLAKAIAMHGLGLYIYAGEDLPEGDTPPAAPAAPEAPPEDERDPFTFFKPHASKAIRAAAQAAIQAFNEGNEWLAYEEATSCIDKLGGDDETIRNQVKLALNHIFRPHSALRASLKKSAEAGRTKETA